MCDKTTTLRNLGMAPAFMRSQRSTAVWSSVGAYSDARITPVASFRQPLNKSVDSSTHSTASRAPRQSIIGLSGNTRSFAMALSGFLTPT